MWIIKHYDGRYVSREGSLSSYTRDIRRARQFAFREEAEANRCPDSETITTIEAECGKNI